MRASSTTRSLARSAGADLQAACGGGEGLRPAPVNPRIRGGRDTGAPESKRLATATRRNQRGFTLLEVMAAFGILAGVVGLVSVIWSQNIDKALNAIMRRELREAGDTIFRRILYEHHKHSDGMGASLEDFYADWCGFKGHARERWGIYRFEMRKRLKVAAGAAGEGSDAESIFGADGTDDQDPSTPFGEEPEEGEGGPVGVNLIEITVNIYEVGEGDKPKITLTTYLKPRGDEDES